MSPSDHSSDAADHVRRLTGPSVQNWSQPDEPTMARMVSNASIDLGWGRLFFGQTFSDHRKLADELCHERTGQRHLALYLRDPHVLLSLAPDRLFLDPSHTYRLWRDNYTPRGGKVAGLTIREMASPQDALEAIRIYRARDMVVGDVEAMLYVTQTDAATYHLAEDAERDAVVGVILGIDHVKAFNDPENGGSFWSLAVDAQCQLPGVGESLVRHIIETLFDAGRDYVDLSVFHDNTEAIRLYEKLGFERVPAFCVKHKNRINEAYYTAEIEDEGLNPYARLIVDEARRRGIRVRIDDAEYGFFALAHGGTTIACRESLSELTTAVAMSRCDDKRVTRRILERAGLKVPDQAVAVGDEEDRAFLQKHESVVVKPARGEQGAGITVDVRDSDVLVRATADARQYCPQVLLEQFVTGEDLRIIVIDYQVIAAAVRRPATLRGTGDKTIGELLERYNRRREAATGGESAVPLDAVTEQCVEEAGYSLEDVLPEGEALRVRKTANLHTGGTIHDVTNELHTDLIDASVRAARALEIPVVGLDMLVPDVTGPEYVFIEANERPGLANHEPQPTAERFIDLLFPQTVQTAPTAGDSI